MWHVFRAELGVREDWYGVFTRVGVVQRPDSLLHGRDADWMRIILSNQASNAGEQHRRRGDAGNVSQMCVAAVYGLLSWVNRCRRHSSRCSDG